MASQRGCNCPAPSILFEEFMPGFSNQRAIDARDTNLEPRMRHSAHCARQRATTGYDSRGLDDQRLDIGRLQPEKPLRADAQGGGVGYFGPPGMTRP
jgi:hypothetical protein